MIYCSPCFSFNILFFLLLDILNNKIIVHLNLSAKKKQKSSFIIIIIIHYPYNSCILNNKNNDNNNKKKFQSYPLSHCCFNIFVWWLWMYCPHIVNWIAHWKAFGLNHTVPYNFLSDSFKKKTVFVYQFFLFLFFGFLSSHRNGKIFINTQVNSIGEKSKNIYI